MLAYHAADDCKAARWPRREASPGGPAAWHDRIWCDPGRDRIAPRRRSSPAACRRGRPE